MAKSYYAYIYTDPNTYEHIYVGKGSRDRASTHMAPRGSQNPILRNIIEKLKLNSQKPIVTKIPTSNEEFAFLLEQGLIKQFGKRVDGTGTLCNFSDGGDGPINLKRSEEAKRKTSISLKKFYLTNKKVIPKDAIAKMSATKRANPKGTGRWMHKDDVQTKVALVDVEKRIAEGWALGTLKKHLTEEYKNKLRAAAIKQWQRQKGMN